MGHSPCTCRDVRASASSDNEDPCRGTKIRLMVGGMVRTESVVLMRCNARQIGPSGDGLVGKLEWSPTRHVCRYQQNHNKCPGSRANGSRGSVTAAEIWSSLARLGALCQSAKQPKISSNSAAALKFKRLQGLVLEYDVRPPHRCSVAAFLSRVGSRSDLDHHLFLLPS